MTTLKGSEELGQTLNLIIEDNMLMLTRDLDDPSKVFIIQAFLFPRSIRLRLMWVDRYIYFNDRGSFKGSCYLFFLPYDEQKWLTFTKKTH